MSRMKERFWALSLLVCAKLHEGLMKNARFEVRNFLDASFFEEKLTLEVGTNQIEAPATTIDSITLLRNSICAEPDSQHLYASVPVPFCGPAQVKVEVIDLDADPQPSTTTLIDFRCHVLHRGALPLHLRELTGIVLCF